MSVEKGSAIHVVLSVDSNVDVNLAGKTVSLKWSGFAEGCVGVMYVFDSHESASDFAAKRGKSTGGVPGIMEGTVLGKFEGPVDNRK